MLARVSQHSLAHGVVAAAEERVRVSLEGLRVVDAEADHEGLAEHVVCRAPRYLGGHPCGILAQPNVNLFNTLIFGRTYLRYTGQVQTLF